MTLGMCVILGLAIPAAGNEAPPSPTPAANEIYIPCDVEDACSTLKRLLPPDFKVQRATEQQLDPLAQERAVDESNSERPARPMAMQLRNMWIHGPGESGRLRRYFERKGIYNADLMVDIIWKAFVAGELGDEFSLKDVVLKTLESANGGFNRVKVDETTRPKVTGTLWPAWLVQKDDLNVIHIFCDDSGIPVWCYDHDSGWASISTELNGMVSEGKAVRYKLGYQDDGGPVVDAIRKMKNPTPAPSPKSPTEGDPEP